MSDIQSIMSKLEDMTNFMQRLENKQEEMKGLLTKDLEEINQNLDDHRERIENLEEKLQALMDTKEEEDLDDWNEIMMAENLRRRMVKKVEMRRIADEKIEKMSFKDKLNLNLKIEAKKAGL